MQVTPRKLGTCANSVHRALFPPSPHKSLGMRLGSLVPGTPGTMSILSQSEWEVAKHALEGFADNSKVLQPSPSSKMVWHNHCCLLLHSGYLFALTFTLLSALAFLLLQGAHCTLLTSPTQPMYIIMRPLATLQRRGWWTYLISSFLFFFFAILTFVTMRLLAPLQHCEQYMCTTWFF